MRKGQITREETKRKISESHKKNGIRPPSALGRIRPESTRLKLSLSHKGKPSPKFGKHYVENDGSTKTDSTYKNWMLKVKNRDGWKCRIANKDCKGRLEAHHILSWREYPELRYEINNGITLCYFHHPRKRVDEKRLQEFFIKIICL